VSIPNRDLRHVQNGDVRRTYGEIKARNSAAQHVRHKHLGLSAVIIDRQIPGAVEKGTVKQGVEQLAVAIDDLQRTLRYRLYCAVRRGHIADEDKPPLQNAERRGQASKLARKERRRVASAAWCNRRHNRSIRGQLDDRGAGSWRLLKLLKFEINTSPGASGPPRGKFCGTNATP